MAALVPLFGGRLNRAQFCFGLLVTLAVLLLAGMATWSDANAALTGWIWMILVWIGGTILLALSAPRLRDLNVSGWWVVPLYGGPYAIGVIGKSLGIAAAGEVLIDVSNMALFVVVLGLGLTPGSKRPNRFGPDTGGLERGPAQQAR
jgi:uncharacterized membrane protein YhaH (DUF805 family)